jgi:hypothetical protein
MSKQVRDHLATLREGLLDHPIYAEVASVEDSWKIMFSPSGISCRC